MGDDWDLRILLGKDFSRAKFHADSAALTPFLIDLDGFGYFFPF
jgi:hypothetical protein